MILQHFLRFCLLTAVLTLVSVAVNAQATVLLRGSILNTKGSKVEMVFTDQFGSSVRASSASDGTYQTVLKAGRDYKVTVLDEDLNRHSFEYSVPPSTNYVELWNNFSLRNNEMVTRSEPVQLVAKKNSKRKKNIKR